MAFDLFKGLFAPDEDIYGAKPEVPDWTELSAKEAQRQAIKGNIGSFDKTKKLAKKVNKFNQQQLLEMLRRGVPQYNQLVRTGSEQALSLLTDENIAAMRRGEIPQDVSDAIQTSAAARAVAGGFGDTGFSRNLVARDLGLKSLDLIEKGFTATQSALTSTEKWLANTAALSTPGLFNVSSMFLTPTQQYEINAREREGAFQRNWLEAQIAASPDPVARGAFDTEMSILSSYLGSSYGNFNKPNYQPAPTSTNPSAYGSVGSFYGGGSPWAAGPSMAGGSSFGGATGMGGASMGTSGTLGAGGGLIGGGGFF